MYNSFFIITLFVCSCAVCCSAQYTTQRTLLDAALQEGMRDWNVPGMAAVVVKDGKVVFEAAYGVKNITSGDPVDTQTMFMLASTSKAITAIALGILVDQNRLNWEDKVIRYLPEFCLSDTFLTQNVRVVDLLTHNLGLKNTDKLWVWDSLSERQIMERYCQIPTSYGFRGGFSYQNVPYIIAGELISRVSGKPWRTFVTQAIFEPLEMYHSAATARQVQQSGNYVSGHIDHYEAGLTALPDHFEEHVGGAGGLWSSIADMGHYLQFLVNRGQYNGKTILRPKTFDYLFRPHVVIPHRNNALFSVIDPQWYTYGLGWFQHDYQGEKLDYHTGTLAGANAIVGVMHDKKTAVYLFANSSDAALRHAFLYKAIDLYAFNNTTGRDWNATVRTLYGGEKESQQQAANRREHNRTRGTHPKFKLTDYCGTYTHAWLGTITVQIENGALVLRHNQYLTYRLEHWHYEVFRTSQHPHWLYRAFVKFTHNEQGNVSGIYYDDPYLNAEFIRE